MFILNNSDIQINEVKLYWSVVKKDACFIELKFFESEWFFYLYLNS